MQSIITNLKSPFVYIFNCIKFSTSFIATPYSPQNLLNIITHK